MTYWRRFSSGEYPRRTGLRLQGSGRTQGSEVSLLAANAVTEAKLNLNLRATDASRGRLSEAVSQAKYAGRRTVITLRGVPAAAVVSMADLDILERASAVPATGGTTR